VAVTISDVARRAGVSQATVSRVLNANYRVAETTRARVAEAIHDLGYIANAHAQALIRSTTGTIGVIIHDVSDPYFGEVVSGMQEVADETGHLVLICSTQRDPSREITHIEMLRSQRVDAVILVGGSAEDAGFLLALAEQARGLRAQGGRLVLCGHHPVPSDAVVIDNRVGGYQATFELLRTGHRRIAHLGGPPRFSTTRERLEGYESAHAAFGLTPDPRLTFSAPFSRDGGHSSCVHLLEAGLAFDAIFAATDLMALGAMIALGERGITVPDDVSVVGFDGIPIARDLVPPLTTVVVPMVEMGRNAMRIAVSPPAEANQIVRLPTHLALRGSIADRTPLAD
jgi:LacI family transcriptional regulator